MRLRIRAARALTLARGDIPRRGSAMGDLSIIDPCDVVIDAGRIVAVGPTGTIAPGLPSPTGAPMERIIDARGRVLMPGFVDAHTHACWAGDRLDEWERRLRGEPYLDILKAGGGIMATVRAVRDASQAELEANLRARLGVMLREGTTTVEVKTGYGLSTIDELKMLRAILRVAGAGRASQGAPALIPAPPRPSWKRDPNAPRLGEVTRGSSAAKPDAPTAPSATIVPTALLGHAIDADQPADSYGAAREGFIRRTIAETLPAVARECGGRDGLRLCIDAFCEEGAWTRDECISLFDRALALGLDVRIHADQFHSLGMVDWAITSNRDLASDGRGAGLARGLAGGNDPPRIRSLDHLEATPAEDLRRLAESGIFGVALPCAGWNTDERFMNARAFVDAGGALVIASNCNPGSAPCSSMPLAIALAARHNGVTPAEAISACTVNAAALLGFDDRAVIAPGRRADLVLLRHTDERALAYEFGGNPVDVVICGGEVVGRASA